MNVSTDLQLDLSGAPSGQESEGRAPRGPAVGIGYVTARRQIARQDAREKARRRAMGEESYAFAIFDKPTDRWIAGVNEMVAPHRFKRRVSLPCFKTADEAMAAGERLIIELNRRG